MWGSKRYFGLTGTRLNVAIGVLAGLDFLLFGYDQGVMGGLLDLPSFVRGESSNEEVECIDIGPDESFPGDRCHSCYGDET